MKEPIFLPHIMAIGRVNISMLKIMQKMYEELEFKKLPTKEDTEILIKTLFIRLYEPVILIFLLGISFFQEIMR